MNPRLKWFQPRLIRIFLCLRCKLPDLKQRKIQINLGWNHFNLGFILTYNIHTCMCHSYMYFPHIYYYVKPVPKSWLQCKYSWKQLIIATISKSILSVLHMSNNLLSYYSYITPTKRFQVNSWWESNQPTQIGPFKQTMMALPERKFHLFSLVRMVLRNHVAAPVKKSTKNGQFNYLRNISLHFAWICIFFGSMIIKRQTGASMQCTCTLSVFKIQNTNRINNSNIG